MKVTAEVKAFLSGSSSLTPQQLQTPEGVVGMSFFTTDMTKYGFTYIGPATVTVDMPDERTLVDNKVEALREQAKSIRADASAKCTAIEGQIQQLLAIEFNPSPAAADQLVTE